MKRLNTYFTMLAIAMLSFTFTSCDEDYAIVDTLEGTWEGDMYVTMTWNDRVYDASRTEICFLTDPYRFKSGRGYWIDRYSGAPWDYIANHTEWEVENGVIYIYLIEDDYEYAIYDYRLTDNYFKGRIYDGRQYIDFRLRHISSPNWNDYDWGYDYDYDYDYYWAKSYSGTRGDARNIQNNSIEKPVRGFRSVR